MVHDTQTTTPEVTTKLPLLTDSIENHHTKLNNYQYDLTRDGRSATVAWPTILKETDRSTGRAPFWATTLPHGAHSVQILPQEFTSHHSSKKGSKSVRFEVMSLRKIKPGAMLNRRSQLSGNHAPNVERLHKVRKCARRHWGYHQWSRKKNLQPDCPIITSISEINDPSKETAKEPTGQCDH